jgi:hypothetical protein
VSGDTDALRRELIALAGYTDGVLKETDGVMVEADGIARKTGVA